MKIKSISLYTVKNLYYLKILAQLEFFRIIIIIIFYYNISNLNIIVLFPLSDEQLI